MSCATVNVKVLSDASGEPSLAAPPTPDRGQAQSPMTLADKEKDYLEVNMTENV